MNPRASQVRAPASLAQRRLSLYKYTVKPIELLAPAGSPEALDAAIGEGADAVYLGLKSFNARMRSSNFAFSQFEAAVDSLHHAGKRIYVAVNTVFEEREADRLYQLLQYLSRVGPDALIVQDLGTVKLVRDNFPSLRLHASTQMNVASAAGANGLSRLGFKRVVLSRELSLPEIEAVKAGSNLELETFVHGALCMSYSGICLFSSFYGGKSANRGTCAQACRRLYQTEEDKGYYFSPKDLELINFVPELIKAGVSSFKIEGRMKSAEYVGAVVAAYRYMIDHWESDRLAALRKSVAILKNDFARSKTSYFVGAESPDFLNPEQAGGTGIALGRVRDIRSGAEGHFYLCDKLAAGSEEGSQLLPEAGDSLRIHSADDSERVTARVSAVQSLESGTWISLSVGAKAGDSIYLIQTKAMTRRYRNVLPNNLDRFRRLPSHDTAPLPTRRKLTRDIFESLPEGVWAMTDRVADLFLFQADPPVKAVLRLSRQSASDLFKQADIIPFKKDKLVIYLEPFFPESDAAWLAQSIDALIAMGVRHFFVNNIGHLSLLRGKELKLIGGDYLYAFNSQAADLLQEMGMDSILPPLEISKQNLMRVAESANLQSSFITLFSYPALFRMKTDLSKQYNFKYFAARANEDFQLISASEGSLVLPQRPFCLTDRREFLEKSGFKRFIVDFSYIGARKPLYKQVMDAARYGKVLPGTERFNWKDGFWNPEEPGKSSSSAAKAPEAESAEYSPVAESSGSPSRPGAKPFSKPRTSGGPKGKAGPRRGSGSKKDSSPAPRPPRAKKEGWPGFNKGRGGKGSAD